MTELPTMSGASSAGQTRTPASVLRPRGSVSLTLSQPHDPDTFYRDRSGLYVFDAFRNRIVTNATPLPAGTRYNISIAELGEPATDREIEDSLPKNHLFDESAVCAIVAEMIGKQQKGEPGDLEHTGCVNLLYTASLVVCVDWFAAYREWRVDAWDRDGIRRYASYRVVSPA
jgi:hypothetical protein